MFRVLAFEFSLLKLIKFLLLGPAWTPQATFAERKKKFSVVLLQKLVPLKFVAPEKENLMAPIAEMPQVGDMEGDLDGAPVGRLVGAEEGEEDGDKDGDKDGVWVGVVGVVVGGDGADVVGP